VHQKKIISDPSYIEQLIDKWNDRTKV